MGDNGQRPMHDANAKRLPMWRSLSERAREADAFETRTPEFAPGADAPPDAVARRDFLRLVGASAALAGAAACSRATRENLHPYVVEPERSVPGNPLFFATSMTIDGYATGLLVESHEGRPTKIEGNAEHPASLGATSAFHQAAVLGLYDPNRARAVTERGAPHTWRALVAGLAAARSSGGLTVLLAPTSSPLVADQVARLRASSPRVDVRWHAPLAPTAAWRGAQITFGEALETRLDLREAAVIVALDSDLLAVGPAALRCARDFADGRRLRSSASEMNRLYVVEPAMSVTGMSADHRLRVRARDVLGIAASLAGALVEAGIAVPRELVAALAAWSSRASAHDAWTRAVARDLAVHRGRSIIVVGDGQPAELHALAHALNDALGNVGKTVFYAPSPIVDAGNDAFDLAPMARALDAGQVETLVVAGGNPVYGAPADLDLARRFALARRSVYLGPYVDETARACQWFAPEEHFLEAWGDARAFDGTLSLIQPLTVPLLDGHATSDLLAALLGDSPTTTHERLVSFWKRARPDAETSWNAWLERGLVPGSAFPSASRSLRHGAVSDAIARMTPPAAGPALEIVFRPDARVRDGAMTNNAWLMEMPDPVTRQTWGNAALLSAATAARIGVIDGDVLQLELAGRRVRAPAMIAPGHADETIALAVGYGRSGDGEAIALGVGTNANALRSAASPWFAAGLVATKTGDRETFALEQEHSSLEGRDDQILLHRTLDEYRRDPKLARASDERPLALYQLKPGGARQWGMVIDLNSCTGCGTCVIACQAENNVPVVGKAGVAKGRAMHWLRIDRYFVGPPEDPRVLLEPMLCQHCEKAPCEYVCPVNATTHSADGLNQMVYNRCVGTRFCSNNCPYKVRRFNWFDYHQGDAPSLASVHNPDVTVRARGVMEKCTYCVQRIRETEIHAGIERRAITDGEVKTACEQSCPSRAITFGDINDPTSRVAKLRENERRFAVLNDLGTVARTRYLARITNPNPELP